MDFCMQFEKLRNDLIEAINNSNLTIGAAFYVFKDVYSEIGILYKETLNKEASGENIKEEKEEIPLVELKNETAENTDVYVPVDKFKIEEDKDFFNGEEKEEE